MARVIHRQAINSIAFHVICSSHLNHVLRNISLTIESISLIAFMYCFTFYLFIIIFTADHGGMSAFIASDLFHDSLEFLADTIKMLR